jgi:carboxymethylenebutenolidase
MNARFAMPSGAPPSGGWPAVIVLYEVFGMTSEMVAVADRFASQNYVALVPDLLGLGSRIVCLARAMLESSSGQPGPVTDRVEHARRWLSAHPDVDRRRLAVIGFCMGGGFALVYVMTRPDGVRAASINYGPVPSDVTRLRGVCPIVASYGGRDLAYGRQARRLAEGLSRFGVEHDVKVYEEAGHSFLTDGDHPIGRLIYLPLRLGYHAAAAEDAWQRIFRFFDRQLAAN